MIWKSWKKLRLLMTLIALGAMAGRASATTFDLRADTTTKTMPDTKVITMWGFALDSAFGANDGTVTVPGPILTVPPGDNTLTIYLDNNLPVPVSVVIPGQIAAMTPVRNPDGRARSFTHETPAGNLAPASYTWNDLRPGTYIYHSGSHPAVQVQMGLYGALKKDYGTGEAYEEIEYDSEVMLFFSEIDPSLHEAVATGNYGPGQAITSTVDYRPQYFLINGEPYAPGLTEPIPAGNAGVPLLLRFFNAGLKSRAPVLLGMHMSAVAEDGYPHTYPRERYSLTLEAMKTKDAIIVPSQAGTYTIFDRALGLTNAQESPGGMYAHLEVAP